MMVGFSGSGKSALAQELAKRLPAVLLSSDLIRKRLARVPPFERLSNDWYTPEKIAEVYEQMRVQTRDWLAAGENVILDATFLSAQERTKTARVTAEGQTRLWIIECECSDSLIRRRLESRGKDTSDANLAVYESQLQYSEPLQ